MEDLDFFSLLHQNWAKTTGAEDTFWMPEEYEDRSGRWRLYAVGDGGTRKLVASSLSDEDSDFISTVHGSLPDLVRRLNDALDEADRLDERVDYQTEQIAELIGESEERESTIQRLKDSMIEKDLLLEALNEEAEYQREQAEFWRSR